MDLREKRKKIGISQEEVAKALKVPRTTYANYESGVCDPSVDILVKLADFYNISLDELVGRPNKNLNLNLLDEVRQNLIEAIVTSNDIVVNRMDAFYQGIKLAEEERKAIIQRIKGQTDNE